MLLPVPTRNRYPHRGGAKRHDQGRQRPRAMARAPAPGPRRGFTLKGSPDSGTPTRRAGGIPRAKTIGANRKMKKSEKSWPEILEATGPLIHFLEEVSRKTEWEWTGDIAPTFYGMTDDGVCQLCGKPDEGWCKALHAQMERQHGALKARVAVCEAWAVWRGEKEKLRLGERPSQQPDRKEVVMLEAYCNGGKLHAYREIIRKDGKATLGPLWIAERDGRPEHNVSYSIN
jgi:hypothetical protein